MLSAQKKPAQIKTADAIDLKVKTLLAKMTLDEKIGQLNQYTSDRLATGPLTPNSKKYDEIKAGKVGSMLNVKGAKETRMVQELAMQSRLKIPLLFGLDVIHGYRVTFPVPLAEAASWDLGMIEQSATRRPVTPITLREGSTTDVFESAGPMAHVPVERV